MNDEMFEAVEQQPNAREIDVREMALRTLLKKHPRLTIKGAQIKVRRLFGFGIGNERACQIAAEVRPQGREPAKPKKAPPEPPENSAQILARLTAIEESLAGLRATLELLQTLWK